MTALAAKTPAKTAPPAGKRKRSDKDDCAEKSSPSKKSKKTSPTKKSKEKSRVGEDAQDEATASSGTGSTSPSKETENLSLNALMAKHILCVAWVHPTELERHESAQTRQLLPWRVKKARKFLLDNGGWCGIFSATVRAVKGTSVQAGKGYDGTSLLVAAQGQQQVAMCGDAFHRHEGMLDLCKDSTIALDHKGRMKANVLKADTPDDAFRRINELINITHDDASAITCLDLMWRLDRLKPAATVKYRTGPFCL